jgi:hypothetical protein
LIKIESGDKKAVNRVFEKAVNFKTIPPWLWRNEPVQLSQYPRFPPTLLEADIWDYLK